MSINQFVFLGRITHTPELKKTTADVSVCSFSVAVERPYKDSEGNYPVDFFDCEAWRSTADFFVRNFHKGDLIGIQGRVETRDYTDKNNNKRRQTKFVCDQISFAGQNGNGKREPGAPAETSQGGFDMGDDDGLPS